MTRQSQKNYNKMGVADKSIRIIIVLGGVYNNTTRANMYIENVEQKWGRVKPCNSTQYEGTRAQRILQYVQR
jgi:hypothetical protein